MARTGFVFHDGCIAHDPGSSHPERPARLEAIRERVDRSGLREELDVLEPEPADVASIEAVHEPIYVESVRQACAQAPRALDGEKSEARQANKLMDPANHRPGPPGGSQSEGSWSLGLRDQLRHHR